MTILDHVLPADVTVERTRNGSRFDPPCPGLDQQRDRLAWALGAIEAETGVRLGLIESTTGWSIVGVDEPCLLGRDPWGGLHLVLAGIRLGQAL